MPTVRTDTSAYFTNAAAYFVAQQKQMSKESYRIEVNGKITEIKKTLEELFKYGYVMYSDERLKDVITVFKRFRAVMNEWHWIILQDDTECKKVIFPLEHWRWNGDVRKYIPITLEEYLIKFGHKKPKELTPEEKDKLDTIRDAIKEAQEIRYPAIHRSHWVDYDEYFDGIS
jgi:hypothetical protein